ARGILAHAFARVRCSSCGDEMLVDRKLFALLENWKPTMSSACGGKVNVASDSCRGEEWFSARDKARVVRENNSSLPPKAACRLRRSSFIAEPRSSREARGPSGAQRQPKFEGANRETRARRSRAGASRPSAAAARGSRPRHVTARRARKARWNRSLVRGAAWLNQAGAAPTIRSGWIDGTSGD